MRAMNLALKINEVAFDLGDPEDDGALTHAAARRLGLWHRIVRRAPRGRTIYRAANCALDYFGAAFQLRPCTDSYLDRDRQWRTEAELTYARAELVAVRFRVIEGRYAAPNYLSRFDDLCREKFGDSVQNGAEWQEWRDAEHYLACRLEPAGPHAEFHWSYRASALAKKTAGPRR